VGPSRSVVGPFREDDGAREPSRAAPRYHLACRAARPVGPAARPLHSRAV